ncbi:hypothetical protein BT69DRAFT_1287860 [Atractiella rhizophila]|nr:hypothetical protein BT69DRAFT_1287860 [Atractiella rhizophila]
MDIRGAFDQGALAFLPQMSVLSQIIKYEEDWRKYRVLLIESNNPDPGRPPYYFASTNPFQFFWCVRELQNIFDSIPNMFEAPASFPPFPPGSSSDLSSSEIIGDHPEGVHDEEMTEVRDTNAQRSYQSIAKWAAEVTSLLPPVDKPA